MSSIFQNKRYQPILAATCAVGWSMAYPLIKAGYRLLQIPSDDSGGKMLFSGARFLFAGILVSAFCLCVKEPFAVKKKTDLWWLALLALVNTTLHYMFALCSIMNCLLITLSARLPSIMR